MRQRIDKSTTSAESGSLTVYMTPSLLSDVKKEARRDQGKKPGSPVIVAPAVRQLLTEAIDARRKMRGEKGSTK